LLAFYSVFIWSQWKLKKKNINDQKNYWAIVIVMEKKMRIAHDLGIWEIPCECKGPEWVLERGWLPLEVSLLEVSEEQEEHLRLLNEAFTSRTPYGVVIKFDESILL
jgi:hypothetical protein